VPFKQLNPSIQKALDNCGYKTATPVQAKAIPVVLEGKDVVASAQTGSGKTAAFVLPALDALAAKKPSGKPSVLILTPTRELATQIVAAARKYGAFVRFNIVSVVGGMPYEPQIRDLKRGADIVVATPGRLIDHMENSRIDVSNVQMLVLDEADRMLDMGFIDDVDAICNKTPADRQTLLFSATIDKTIMQVVKRLLNSPVFIDLSQEKISTPKIKQTVYKVKNVQHKSRLLKHFLNDENIYKAIIFSATKMHADKLADELSAEGFAAAALHGDLRQNVRNRRIDSFRRGKIQFLIATDVAARGLDINDITHVINYDLPKFCEDYVHRIGRTGRAGKEGEAISFCSSADLRNLQRIERYIGQRLTLQQDNFKYTETPGNTRSDAEKFSPENMHEPMRGGRGASNRRFNGDKREKFDKPHKRFDKPQKRFERDDEKSSDKPVKRFDREEKSFDKPASEKPRKRFEREEKLFDEYKKSNKSFDKPRKTFERDTTKSTDAPRKRFDRDDTKSFDKAPKRFDRDGAKSLDKPRKRFDRDDTKSFDKPRKRADRDDSKSFDTPRKRFDRDDTKSFDKPRKRFDRDDTKSFDKPRKRSDRDDSKSFDKPRKSADRDGQKSFDKPRKRSDRDGGKSFGKSDNRFDKPRKQFDRDEKKPRRDNVFERPVYEFEQRDGNPKVKYKKRVESKTPSRERGDQPKSRAKTSGKFTKKPFRSKK
jgi:superfamily II DNA/RNA helicase